MSGWHATRARRAAVRGCTRLCDSTDPRRRERSEARVRLPGSRDEVGAFPPLDERDEASTVVLSRVRGLIASGPLLSDNKFDICVTQLKP